MLVSIKTTFFSRLNSLGLTVFELMLTIAVSFSIMLAITTIMITFYGGIVAINTESRLAVESQAILENVVEELRVSSGIRSNNTISDPNAPGGGWTTSNDDLILIISTPALTPENEFVTNPVSGSPYQNEIVYFAQDNILYQRTLAHPNVAENTSKTTCPEATASNTCPRDIVMSTNFDDMSFIFYDQDDDQTATLSSARSIELFIDMYRQSFGKDIRFQNNIRITLRNTTL